MKQTEEDSAPRRLPASAYKRIFDGGRVIRGRLFTAWVMCPESAGRQVGVIVSKKSFHDAVDRNRAKRILRAGFRAACAELPCGSAWILTGRHALEGKQTADVVSELRWMCQKFLSSSVAPTK